ncbi:13230_t:CDS:2, partial [Ambispora leptoticha]
MTIMQDHKSKLTQAIDKIIMQKIEKADYQDYDSESEDELKDLKNKIKDIISNRKPAIKNLITTND